MVDRIERLQQERSDTGFDRIAARRRAASQVEGAEEQDVEIEGGRAMISEEGRQRLETQAREQTAEQLLDRIGAGFNREDVIVDETESGFEARVRESSVTTPEEARTQARESLINQLPEGFGADDVNVVQEGDGFRAELTESAGERLQQQSEEQAVSGVLEAAGPGFTESDVAVTQTEGGTQATLKQEEVVKSRMESREEAVQAVLDAAGPGASERDVLVNSGDDGFRARLKQSAVDRINRERREQAESQARESIIGSFDGRFGEEDVAVEWTDNEVSASLTESARGELEEEAREEAISNLLGQYERFGREDIETTRTDTGFEAFLDDEAMSELQAEAEQEARTEARQGLLERAGDQFTSDDVVVEQTDEGFAASISESAIQRENDEARQEARESVLSDAGGEFSMADVEVQDTEEGFEAFLSESAIQRERQEARDEAVSDLLADAGDSFTREDVEVQQTDEGFEAFLAESAVSRREDELRSETEDRVVSDLLGEAGSGFTEADVDTTWEDGEVRAALEESAVQRERDEMRADLRQEAASAAGDEFTVEDITITQDGDQLRTELTPAARERAVEGARDEAAESLMDQAGVDRSDVQVTRVDEGFEATLTQDAMDEMEQEARRDTVSSLLDEPTDGGETLGDIYNRSDVEFVERDGDTVATISDAAREREQMAARYEAEWELTDEFLEAEIEKTGGQTYGDYFTSSDIEVAEEDGMLVPTVRESALEEQEDEIAQDISAEQEAQRQEEIEGGSSWRDAINRQIFQGGVIDYWADRVDPDVVEALDDTRGWLSDEQEQTVRDIRREAGEHYGEIGADAERSLDEADFIGSNVIGDVTRGVWEGAEMIAKAPADVALITDTATEAAIQTPQTVRQEGVVDTAATGAAVANLAGASLVTEAVTDPAGFVGEAAAGFGAGTAAVKATEKVADTARSVQVARRGDRETVEIEDITTSEQDIVEGKNPTFETGTAAPVSEAVQEIRERAADNPGAVTPGEGDTAVYHTTTSKFDADLEVGEGASELPGIFTSPDASPIGLMVGGAENIVSSVKPRMPNLGGRSDRIVTMPGDDVRAMGDDATGSGYGVRDPETGEQIEGGMGRGEAKSFAEDTDYEVRPDLSTSGYEYLSETAEEGVAYVRPTGSRTPELEAIYPEGTRFTQEGVTPVRVGATNVPESVPVLGGSRIPATGRLIPAERYVRADADAVDAADDVAQRTGDVSDSVSGYDISPSRISRRDGVPAAPGPVSTGGTTETDAAGTTTIESDGDYGVPVDTPGYLTDRGTTDEVTETPAGSPSYVTDRDTEVTGTTTGTTQGFSDYDSPQSWLSGQTTRGDQYASETGSWLEDASSGVTGRRSETGTASSFGGAPASTPGASGATDAMMWALTASGATAGPSRASEATGWGSPTGSGSSVTPSPTGSSGPSYTGWPTRPGPTRTEPDRDDRRTETERDELVFGGEAESDDDPYYNVGWIDETVGAMAGVDVATAVRASTQEEVGSADWGLETVLDEDELGLVEEEVGWTL